MLEAKDALAIFLLVSTSLASRTGVWSSTCPVSLAHGNLKLLWLRDALQRSRVTVCRGRTSAVSRR